MVGLPSRRSVVAYLSLSRGIIKVPGKARVMLAWVCIALIFAALLGNIRPMVSRTAVVTADTTALRIVFDSTEHWLVEGGLALCLANTDRRASLHQNDPVCNQFISGGEYKRLTIDPGDGLEIRVEPSGTVLIRFVPCDSDRQDCGILEESGENIRPRQAPNGFVVASPEALRAAGPLAMSGWITLGRDMSTGGSSDFLLGGSYEIREQSLLTRMFGRRSVAVERGELIPGSEVMLLSGKEPSVHSKGHFFMSSQNGQPLLRAVALSETGDGSLRMKIKGVESIDIDPDWIDSVVASPVFFALAFLIGLLMNAIQLVSALTRKEKRLESPE